MLIKSRDFSISNLLLINKITITNDRIKTTDFNYFFRFLFFILKIILVTYLSMIRMNGINSYKLPTKFDNINNISVIIVIKICLFSYGNNVIIF